MAKTNGEITVKKELDIMDIETMKMQALAIQELMKALLRSGEHYGVIPGTEKKDKDGNDISKPSLFKPGAEKVSIMFKLAAEYDIKRYDYDNGHREYEIKGRLRHKETGVIWGEGVGTCTTLETRYRFRKASRVCPECGKATIIKGQEQYGGGFVCWKRKGGCGAKWPDDDPKILALTEERQENENIADTYNTVFKIGKKRCHVDMVLSCTAASDFFTQDLEDLKSQIDITSSTRVVTGEDKKLENQNQAGEENQDKGAKYSPEDLKKIPVDIQHAFLNRNTKNKLNLNFTNLDGLDFCNDRNNDWEKIREDLGILRKDSKNEKEVELFRLEREATVANKEEDDFIEKAAASSGELASSATPKTSTRGKKNGTDKTN